MHRPSRPTAAADTPRWTLLTVRPRVTAAGPRPPSIGAWRAVGVWVAAALIGGTGVSATAAERALDKQVDVPAGVDAVWAAWTTREGIVSFFAPDAEIDARVGGAFHIYIDPLAPPGSRGADEMRFLALQPKRMLSFDWNAPPHLATVRAQRTFVVVRLQPLDEQRTRVTLHHTGWGDGGEWDQAYAYFDKAWAGVLDKLQQRFERGPQDWTAWMKQLEAWHRPTPASASR